MNTPEHNAENALKDAYAFIDGMDPDAEAYANALASIRELEAICAKHRDETRRAEKHESELDKQRAVKFPSPDTIVTCATSLVSVLLVVKAESILPVTSKALGLITKVRV